MNGITCDVVRAAALDPLTAPRDWMQRPDAANHIRQCPACQDWLDAFAAGEREWASEPADAFAAQVVARTAGVDEVLRDLPLLAGMDPGPGFAERVLSVTSRRASPQGWRARAALAWQGVVRRPRFAWEAAYVAVLCWVLAFGNPVAAFEWSASNIGAVAGEHLAGPVNDLRSELDAWGARLAPDPIPAKSANAAPRTEAPPPVGGVWKSATDLVGRAVAFVSEALTRAWTSFGAWVDWLAQQVWPPPAEPQASPARSPQ